MYFAEEYQTQQQAGSSQQQAGSSQQQAGSSQQQAGSSQQQAGSSQQQAGSSQQQAGSSQQQAGSSQQQAGSSQQQAIARTIWIQSQQISRKKYPKLCKVHKMATEHNNKCYQISSSTCTCHLDVFQTQEQISLQQVKKYYSI